MIGVKNLQEKYELKDLELNSLLEITQAINNNLPEESLYKIYNFTLRANLNIQKLALYVLDDDWNCKVHFGTRVNYSNKKLPSCFLEIENVAPVEELLEVDSFEEFQLAIPVAHKKKKLAFVFVGGNSVEAKKLNTNFIQALSNIIIVAIENKKLARKQLEQEMLRRELDIAAKLQKFLFPKELPETKRLKLSSYYQPHHSIGGDYYDYISINESQKMLCIADVSGKGIPAAMLMSNFQASLHVLSRKTNLLYDIITELNYQIINNAQGQHFITFFVAIYDFKESRLKFVNAGHNPPFLIRDGKISRLTTGTTILGAFDVLPFLEVGVIEDITKFKIFSYTDGLTELTNKDNEEYGDHRVEALLHENMDIGIGHIQNCIIQDMEEFKGKEEFKDDITLLLCEVNNEHDKDK